MTLLLSTPINSSVRSGASAAPQLEVEHHEPLPLHATVLIGLIFSGLVPITIVSMSKVMTTAMLCLVDIISQYNFPFSSFFILSIPTSWMVSEPWVMVEVLNPSYGVGCKSNEKSVSFIIVKSLFYQ